MTKEASTLDSFGFRTATIDDIDFVSLCNYISTSPSPGFCYWDPLIEGLGVDTITFIKSAIHHEVLSWCRIDDYIIVTNDSEKLAGASRFVMSERDYRPFNLEKATALYTDLHWSAEDIKKFEERYASVWVDPKDETLRPSGTWTIECVAVLESARGRGIGKALMLHIIEEAKAKGIDSIGISVTPGNDIAKNLYISAGFKPYITYFKEYYYDMFPGTEKFRIRLSEA